jgi:hypothetical protein
MENRVEKYNTLCMINTSADIQYDQQLHFILTAVSEN